jgi:hypothetical protein
MGKNTNHGYRRGAVRDRSEVKSPTGSVKRGQFMDKKSDSKPVKGVTKER